MQSRLPKRNLAACTRIEVECQFLPASILTVSAAERSLAFRSRVATCYGIKPLSHPAVRQPRSSDKWTWSLVEQAGEPRSFAFALLEQKAHHALKGRRRPATGLF